MISLFYNWQLFLCLVCSGVFNVQTKTTLTMQNSEVFLKMKNDFNLFLSLKISQNKHSIPLSKIFKLKFTCHFPFALKLLSNSALGCNTFASMFLLCFIYWKFCLRRSKEAKAKNQKKSAAPKFWKSFSFFQLSKIWVSVKLYNGNNQSSKRAAIVSASQQRLPPNLSFFYENRRKTKPIIYQKFISCDSTLKSWSFKSGIRMMRQNFWIHNLLFSKITFMAYSERWATELQWMSLKFF